MRKSILVAMESISRKITLRIGVFVYTLLCVGSFALANTNIDELKVQDLVQAERLGMGQQQHSMRKMDLSIFEQHYALGGDLFSDFIRFLFPISGREKRTIFLSTPYWGKKKPQYQKFDWSRYESDHFDFLAYPEASETLRKAITYFEEEYERNDRIFGVQHLFSKKIPVVLYHTRRDFEQTSIIDGPVPLGLGGLTEVVSWKRVTFPFEGELEKFEHVAKHEGTHVFQIAKNARRLPLWFIEGSAETNSVYWDSEAEMIIRDAYLNGFFYPISDLWQIQGSWLMYKIGNFITNVIWDEYGERGFKKIFEEADELKFEKNIKESLGISIEELERKVQDRLVQRYGSLLQEKDITDQSRLIAKKQKLLSTYKNFFVSGAVSGPSSALYLNVIEADGSIVSKKIVEDRNIYDESLEYFQKGADLTENEIWYSVKQSKTDQIKMISYRYNAKKKKFSFNKPKVFSWPQFERIQHVTYLGSDQIAFIGYEGGYSNIYVAHLGSKKIEQLTKGESHIEGLDWCASNRNLVYSKEMERNPKAIAYNRDLFLLQIDEKKETRLTKTSNQDEMQPRCSADGNQILYTSNPDSTFDIMLYDRAHGKTQRLTHMRVGANHPAWGPEQSILFNAFEKLSPSIFQSAIPNAKERLFADLPSTSQRKFFKWNGTEFTLSSERNIDQEVNLISEPVFEGKYVVNRQLVIREGLKNYTANSIAFVGDELVCRSFNGLPGDKNVRQDQYPQYFRFHGNEVKSLRSNMVAEKGLSQQTKIWASVHLEGRPIVQAWESQSQKYSLLQVNNRMASEYRNMKNRPPLGLVMYDHDRNHSTEISDSQVRRILRNQLQWVSFLDGSRVFFASGSKASGPFELFVWDSGKMTMLSNDAIRFTISKTHKSLAWIDTKNRLYHVRSSELAGDKKNVIDYRGKLIGFEFSDQETLIGITSSKTSAVYIQYFQPSHQTYKVVLDSGERIVNVAIDRSGTIAFLTQKKSDSTEFFVKVWDWNEKAIKKIDQHHHNISHFVFRDGYLTYIKRNLHAKPNREIVWKVGSSLPQYFDPIVGVLESNDQENLIVESKRYLRVYGAKDKKTHHVAGEIVGMDLKNDQIFFSEASERNFAVYQYDISTAQKNRISKGNVDSIFPKVFEESVYWSEKNEYWDLRSSKETFPSISYDVLEKKIEDRDLWVSVDQSEKKVSLSPTHTSDSQYPGMLLSRPAPQQIKVQNLSAAAAFDGSNLRYFVSGYADNLFSDKGIFVNSVFLGSAKYASIGYSDLRNAYSTSFFYNSRQGINNFGVDISKNFLLDQYRQVTWYTDLEYQNYSQDSSIQNAFVEPSFNGQSFYLVKTGMVYAFDGTSHDMHGPIEGSRFFFRSEAGLDTQGGELSNFDANIDFRLYKQLLPRFGLAHRLVGGTSQGNVSNIYIMGGNITFRGLPFEDLAGQNYWVLSQDVRLPVFDFIGAKLFDPLDQVFGFLTRFFDVRSGVYTDVGDAWNNDEDMDVRYSFGYFVNIPTSFGIIFRFNQGLLGEKSLGFWIGTNW